eukprot:scaffold14.g1037.t1
MPASGKPPLEQLEAVLAGLGYPDTLPQQDLHATPNFEFVADCLLWLCQRAAPGISAPRDYSTEQARVAFLNAVATQLYASTRVKLDLKRLYRAGGSAGKELVRLAAHVRELGAGAGPNAAPGSPAGGTAPARATKAASPGAARRGQHGRRRGQEGGLSSEAAAAAQRAAEVAALETLLDGAVEGAKQRLAALQRSVAELNEERRMLEARPRPRPAGRVEKRHVELDRLEQRLESLQAVKPAHSEAVEALERQLAELFTAHLHKFRNLEYLEGEMAKRQAARDAAAEEAHSRLRKIQRQAASEWQRVLQGDPLPGEASNPSRSSSEDSESEGPGGGGAPALPRLALARGAAGAAGAGGGAISLLLVPEDSGGSGSPSARSRLSSSAAAQGPAGAPGLGLIPAHRGSLGGGGGGSLGSGRPGSSRRPSSATGRRASSSAGSAAGGFRGTAQADVLVVGPPVGAGALGVRAPLDAVTGGDF